MLVLGSREASWSATDPMPWAGRQLEPVARHLITYANRREDTRRSLSKKMPPRNGQKKRSMISGEKPSA